MTHADDGQGQRKVLRTPIEADVKLRRNSHSVFRVPVVDVSTEGCRLEFVERPQVDDKVWVTFDGLETLEGRVCWVDGFLAGLEFDRPMHPAVFDNLLTRLGNDPH